MTDNVHIWHTRQAGPGKDVQHSLKSKDLISYIIYKSNSTPVSFSEVNIKSTLVTLIFSNLHTMPRQI